MAPRKQKGAPASTAKVPLTKAELKAQRSATNKAKHVTDKQTFFAEAEKLKPAAPPKSKLLKGQSNPEVLKEHSGNAPRCVYTIELGEELFEHIAMGMSMEKIGRLPNMPHPVTLMKWVHDMNHPFNKVYTEAKQLMVYLLEERAMDVANDPLMGDIVTQRQAVTKDGDVVDLEETRTSDNVERSKLKLMAIQWSLSHLNPRKHGRNPDQGASTGNEQLKGMLDALKAGPAE